jgi:hypothetical protein
MGWPVAAAPGAARARIAPHSLLSYSTQLRPCSKNGRLLSRDIMEQPPFPPDLLELVAVPSCVVPRAQHGCRSVYIASSHGGAYRGTVCVGFTAACSHSKGVLSALMGRDSTFKN